MIQRILIKEGEKRGGELPVTRKPKEQNLDVLEFSHCLVLDDNVLISFIIKAIVFLFKMAQLISRVFVVSKLIDETFGSFMKDDPTEVNEFTARKLRGFKSDNLCVFRSNLSLHHLYNQEAYTHRFGLQYRQALADIPTQAEALHGATCSNYFCTYVI